MTREAPTTTGFDWGEGTTATDRFILAKPKYRRSYARRWDEDRWTQAAEVSLALAGPAWRMRLVDAAPVPSWLIELTRYRIESAALLPVPALFRTSGITSGWLDAAWRTAKGELEVRGRHGVSDLDLQHLFDGIALLDGLADADVYVFGDGRPAGKYLAEVHRVFARFAVTPERKTLEALGESFAVSITATGGVSWTPRRRDLR